MNELERKLKQLQTEGFESVGITQCLNWVHEIKKDKRIKRLKL